jgi:hypothetical protein
MKFIRVDMSKHKISVEDVSPEYNALSLKCNSQPFPSPLVGEGAGEGLVCHSGLD